MKRRRRLEDGGLTMALQGLGRLTIPALAFMTLTLAGLAEATVTVDGRLTADEVEYSMLAADPGRGTLYVARQDSHVFLLLRVEGSVNDNVFGSRTLDQDYLASLGWTTGNHRFRELHQSDHMELTLGCGAYFWSWSLDYVYDADRDLDPTEPDWLSGVDGPDGWGPPPPDFVSASSLQWNMNNTLWDVLLGGARTDLMDDGKSPDPAVGYPGFHAGMLWEWAMIYEMSMDVGVCDCERVSVGVPAAHNSPSKDGDPNIVFPAMAFEGAEAALGHVPDLVCEGESVILDGSPSAGCGAGMLYRWLQGTTVLCDWSSLPTCEVVPPGDYTLEVRCEDDPTCSDTLSVEIGVAPAPVPELLLPEILCTGSSITLDASGSNPSGCPVPLEFRFLGGARELRAWSQEPTFGPIPASEGTLYAAEVRCGTCVVGATASPSVVPMPSAEAGPDLLVCLGEPVLLDASASEAPECLDGPLFEWWRGGQLVRPAGPNPTLSPPTGSAGTETYTVVVSCPSAPGCEATDQVEVTVEECLLTVQFASVEALLEPNGVRIRWRTLREQESAGFRVERSDSEAGPFELLAPVVWARGSGSRYEVFIDGGDAHTWYRIVELTYDGRGDVSDALRPSAPARGRDRTRSDSRH